MENQVFLHITTLKRCNVIFLYSWKITVHNAACEVQHSWHKLIQFYLGIDWACQDKKYVFEDNGQDIFTFWWTSLSGSTSLILCQAKSLYI